MTTPSRRTSSPPDLPPSAAAAFVDDLARTGQDPHAVKLTRHGRALLDVAWAPYRSTGAALVYSVTKTWTALAIGFLVHEGRLEVDARLSDVLGLPPSEITIHHLLAMNTGHSAEQVESLGFDPARLLATPPEHPPGSHFVYNSPATFALSHVVTRLSGEDLTAYLQPRLLDPLGIPPRWMRRLDGIEQGFSGYHLTVDDISRLCVALAQGGRLEGEQVIPAAWVTALSQPWSDNRDPAAPAPSATEAPNDWWQGYGYQVWRNRRGFRLDGAFGQFGLVLPDEGITLAYQGASHETHHVLDAFWALLDRWEEAADTPSDVAGQEANEDVAERLARLDSWETRSARLPSGPDGGGEPVDVSGWELWDRDSGWELRLPPTAGPEGTAPGGSLPVRTEWTTTVLTAGAPESPGSLALATRAEPRGERSLAVEIADLTSPHRLELLRSPEGTLTACWHTAPLRAPSLAALAVPLALAEQAAG